MFRVRRACKCACLAMRACHANGGEHVAAGFTLSHKGGSAKASCLNKESIFLQVCADPCDSALCLFFCSLLSFCGERNKI